MDPNVLEPTFVIKQSDLAALFAGVQAYVSGVEAVLKPLGVVVTLSKQLAADWQAFQSKLQPQVEKGTGT